MTGEERRISAARIRAVADALVAVQEQIVFIGGTVLPLLVDVDGRFYAPRMTDDVDAVGVAANYTASHRVEAAVAAAGFKPNPKARHKGSWIGPTGEKFDLSFAGDFAGASGALVDSIAIETAQEMDGHPAIRHLSPTGLFLMKCAAHHDRGRKRPFESKDLADLAVLLVASDLRDDVKRRAPHVQAEVKRRALGLLAEHGLQAAIQSHFGDRMPIPPDTSEELSEEALAALAELTN